MSCDAGKAPPRGVGKNEIVFEGFATHVVPFRNPFCSTRSGDGLTRSRPCVTLCKAGLGERGAGICWEDVLLEEVRPVALRPIGVLLVVLCVEPTSKDTSYESGCHSHTFSLLVPVRAIARLCEIRSTNLCDGGEEKSSIWQHTKSSSEDSQGV